VGRVDYLVSYAVSLDAKTRAPAVKVERTGHPRKAGQRSNQREATGMAVEGRCCAGAAFFFIGSFVHAISLVLHTKAKATQQQVFCSFFLFKKDPQLILKFL
jgi:hypothetical protein